MASTPTLPKASLSVVSLFLSLFCSSVVSHRFILDHANPPHSYSHAEKLRRSLNLISKESLNIIKGDHADFVPGEIVEKKFSFLGNSGPPVEDLGHHAGFYSLPHSKASR